MDKELIGLGLLGGLGALALGMAIKSCIALDLGEVRTLKTPEICSSEPSLEYKGGVQLYCKDRSGGVVACDYDFMHSRFTCYTLTK